MLKLFLIILNSNTTLVKVKLKLQYLMVSQCGYSNTTLVKVKYGFDWHSLIES